MPLHQPSCQETIPGITDELTANYQESNINAGDASTSQRIMRPQQRSVASRISPMNAITKKISPTTEVHSKGRKNVVPGHTNEAMNSAPHRRLTRDMRSISVLSFLPNRSPNKEEQTTSLSSLADSQEAATKTEETAA